MDELFTHEQIKHRFIEERQTMRSFKREYIEVTVIRSAGTFLGITAISTLAGLIIYVLKNANAYQSGPSSMGEFDMIAYVSGIAGLIAAASVLVLHVAKWRTASRIHQKKRTWYTDSRYPVSIRLILQFVEKHIDDPLPESIVDIYGVIQTHKTDNEEAVLYAASNALSGKSFISSFRRLIAIFDDSYYLEMYSDDLDEMVNDPFVQSTTLEPLEVVRKEFRERIHEYEITNVRTNKQQIHDLLAQDMTTLQAVDPLNFPVFESEQDVRLENVLRAYENDREE